jgi:hypothetical protein
MIRHEDNAKKLISQLEENGLFTLWNATN